MPTSPNHIRNLRKIYVFDGRENLIGEYETVTACAEALHVKRQALTMAVSRASILAKKYYVSYQDKFARQTKQKEFNPLRPPVRVPRTVAGMPHTEALKKTVFLEFPAATAATKTAAKRTPGISLRPRSMFPYQEERAFWPVSSFH